MDGALGLAGWRWLFILEGIPSCVSALAVLALLPDYPEDAGWLSGPEKALAAQRLLHEGSKGRDPTMSWADARATLTEWRLYAHYALYVAISPGFASLSLFAPTIVAGLGHRDLTAQLMTVPPWAAVYGGSAAAAETMVTWRLIPGAACHVAVAYSADRLEARGAHTAGAALVGAAGFVASAALPPTAYAARYGGLFVATSGAFACIPPLLGWLSSNVASTAATGLAIAINVSIGGGLGQIPGVWIYKPGEAGPGIPDGPLDQRGPADACRRAVHRARTVLPAPEQQAERRGGEGGPAAKALQAVRAGLWSGTWRAARAARNAVRMGVSRAAAPMKSSWTGAICCRRHGSRMIASSHRVRSSTWTRSNPSAWKL